MHRSPAYTPRMQTPPTHPTMGDAALEPSPPTPDTTPHDWYAIAFAILSSVATWCALQAFVAP